MINIAILGFGLIGSGVADVIEENSDIISKKIGDTINIKYILDLRKIENHILSDRLVTDFNTILNDADISLIVETMGGSHPAFDYTNAALKRGISVVTSNKEVVAKFGAELLKTAAENNAKYFFEASVGGGIPIIRPMYNCLAANKINKISAILNGTTNFILTKMEKDNLSFDECLKLAQENGFAERDPSADIDGIDTCRKICILSSLAFGRQLPPEKVHTEGIRNMSLADIKNASALNCKIKLIAKSETHGDYLYVIVAPMLVHESCPLCNIEDAFNGIMLNGNVIGDVMFYGKGAGQLPTASAVTADMMDSISNITKNIMWDTSDGNYVLDFKTAPVRYYIRACYTGNDPELVIKSIFPCADVHIPKIEESEKNLRELFFMTKEYTSSEFDIKVAELSRCGFDVLSRIRVL